MTAPPASQAVDDAASAPAQVEVGPVEFAQVEFAQVELAQVERAQVELAQVELAQVEFAQVELAEFESIRSHARLTNLARLAQVDGTLRRWRAEAAEPAEDAQVAALVHQVVGSAGTFGFTAVSRLARGFEDLQRTARDGPGFTRDVLVELARLVAVMRTNLEGGTAGG